MISVQSDDTGSILEITISGRITKADYDDVLIPAVEAALQGQEKIRLVAHVTADFEGYDLAAAWSDTRLGVSHWSGFDRVALVTDVGWIASGVRAMAFLAPCPVEVFALSQLEEARVWIRESLGSIHLTDEGNGVLHVQLMGKLDTEAYAGVDEHLDAFIRENEDFSLLLDLRDFDGWQGLSGVLQHLSLVRTRAKYPRRVAVLGNSGWQRMGERIVRRFVNAEAGWFEDPSEAQNWVGAS